jgi:hypothetical protein
MPMTETCTPPLLSIVIPTRNRQVYLLCLLNHLARSQRRDFEVVIQDNSDDPTVLRDAVATMHDPRMRYGFRQERLTIDINCDLAMARACGTYVCMLGDDDGLLLDESLLMLAAMARDKVDAIVTAASYYAWPTVRHKTWGQIGGKLFTSGMTGQIRSLDANGERNKVLRTGGALGLFQLPRVYHAFVRRDVLQRLADDAKTFFPGPSPDMANAIGLTRYVQRYVHIDYPFIVMGHSQGSGGGMGSEKKHQGDLASQAHLPVYTVSTWDPAIPFYWSGPTIYAQSAYHAIGQLFDRPSNPLNYAYLYATCLVYERHLWRKTFTAMRSNPQSGAPLLLRMAGYFCMILLRRSKSFIRNIFKFALPQSAALPAEDIAAAIEATQRDAHSKLPAAYAEAASPVPHAQPAQR